MIYITTQGGPGNASTTLNIHAYKRGFEFLDIGYASAMMISLSAVVFGCVLIFARLRRKRDLVAPMPGYSGKIIGDAGCQRRTDVVLMLVIVAPIVWMVLASFKNRVDVTQHPTELLFTPTLDNYRQLFIRSDFLFTRSNSFIVAGGSTILGLLLAVPAAFAISWHRMTWPATFTLFARMAPGTLFLLPWFLMFSGTGLSGTHLALIITHAVITLPIALWTMLPYFDAFRANWSKVPRSTAAGPAHILAAHSMPIVAPGVVVATILCFIFSWNYFLFALVLVRLPHEDRRSSLHSISSVKA